MDLCGLQVGEYIGNLAAYVSKFDIDGPNIASGSDSHFAERGRSPADADERVEHGVADPIGRVVDLRFDLLEVVNELVFGKFFFARQQQGKRHPARPSDPFLGGSGPFFDAIVGGRGMRSKITGEEIGQKIVIDFGHPTVE